MIAALLVRSSVAFHASVAPAMLRAFTLLTPEFVPLLRIASVPPLIERTLQMALLVASAPAPALVKLIEAAFSAMIVGAVSVEEAGFPVTTGWLWMRSGGKTRGLPCRTFTPPNRYRVARRTLPS